MLLRGINGWVHSVQCSVQFSFIDMATFAIKLSLGALQFMVTHKLREASSAAAPDI